MVSMETKTTALDHYNLDAAMASIPADVRWSAIRLGLAHSVQMSHFTLRTGAERRGSAFVPKAYTAHDANACGVALFGRVD